MQKAFNYYKDTYKNIFGKHGKKIETVITTTEIVKNVFVPRNDMWQGFVMKLSDGASIEQHIEYFREKALNRSREEAIKYIKKTQDTSYFIDENEIKRLSEKFFNLNEIIPKDFLYRLHRSLDLLIYKWIYNTVFESFFHADMHAGNVFFDYSKNIMTIIDWGAVGTINTFEKSDSSEYIRNLISSTSGNDYDDMSDITVKYMESQGNIFEDGCHWDITDEKSSDINDMLKNFFTIQLWKSIKSKHKNANVNTDKKIYYIKFDDEIPYIESLHIDNILQELNDYKKFISIENGNRKMFLEMLLEENTRMLETDMKKFDNEQIKQKISVEYNDREKNILEDFKNVLDWSTWKSFCYSYDFNIKGPQQTKQTQIEIKFELSSLSKLVVPIQCMDYNNVIKIKNYKSVTNFDMKLFSYKKHIEKLKSIKLKARKNSIRLESRGFRWMYYPNIPTKKNYKEIYNKKFKELLGKYGKDTNGSKFTIIDLDVYNQLGFKEGDFSQDIISYIKLDDKGCYVETKHTIFDKEVVNKESLLCKKVGVSWSRKNKPSEKMQALQSPILENIVANKNYPEKLNLTLDDWEYIYENNPDILKENSCVFINNYWYESVVQKEGMSFSSILGKMKTKQEKQNIFSHFDNETEDKDEPIDNSYIVLDIDRVNVYDSDGNVFVRCFKENRENVVYTDINDDYIKKIEIFLFSNQSPPVQTPFREISEYFLEKNINIQLKLSEIQIMIKGLTTLQGLCHNPILKYPISRWNEIISQASTPSPTKYNEILTKYPKVGLNFSEKVENKNNESKRFMSLLNFTDNEILGNTQELGK